MLPPRRVSVYFRAYLGFSSCFASFSPWRAAGSLTTEFDGLPPQFAIGPGFIAAAKCHDARCGYPVIVAALTDLSSVVAYASDLIYLTTGPSPRPVRLLFRVTLIGAID
jgi:hypothetical protein